jgi:hypothetical protein
MALKDPASPGGVAPLRLAVADAYERASGLAAYFGQLTRDLASESQRLPDAPSLAEAEAMILALEAIVRELPRLVPGFAERIKAAADEDSQAAG